MRASFLPVYSALLLLLAACGGGNAPPVPAATQPLRIEARENDGDWALYLQGQLDPLSNDELLGALDKHAEVVDPLAGFTGRDPTGCSENLVIVGGPPAAPIEPFLRVIECAVAVLFGKIGFELQRPSLPPLRTDVEFPRDESLGPNRDNVLIIDVGVEQDEVAYTVGLAAREKVPVPAARFAVGESDSWGNTRFAARQRALLAAAVVVTDGYEFYDAGIGWASGTSEPSWGAVFQAFSAIETLNTARRESQSTIISVWPGQYSAPPSPDSPPD